MLGIVVIFGIAAFVTGAFIIIELNWSVQNCMHWFEKFKGPLKIFAIPVAPFCFMPVIIDVLITIGINMLLDASGMMGMMVSMIICSVVAGYLYRLRRQHGWKWI